MTRTEDEPIYDDGCDTVRKKKVSDIKNRAKLFDSFDNPVLLSIHQNKYTDKECRGTQVFYSANNIESKVIAQILQDSFVNLLQNDNRRTVKKSGSEIYLLYTAKKPAVMIECGFMSNPEELKKLNSSQYQSSVSAAIFLGLNDYYKDKGF